MRNFVDSTAKVQSPIIMLICANKAQRMIGQYTDLLHLHGLDRSRLVVRFVMALLVLWLMQSTIFVMVLEVTTSTIRNETARVVIVLLDEVMV